jgi:hypothetical protein
MLEGRGTFFREMLFDKGYEVCVVSTEKEEASGGQRTDPGAGTRVTEGFGGRKGR